MFIAQAATALGFGELNLESYLNQPLRAVIPLHGMGGLEPGNIHARLADVDAYRRLGLSEHERPLGLRFEVENGRLRVLGERPQRSPVLELVIELNWSGGHLLRGYSLLLDPPPLNAVGKAVAEQRPRQVTVGRGDSLGSIAQRLVEGSDVNPTQMMLALFQHNPRAFARGDINALKLGARLRVPGLADVRAMDAEGAQRSIYGGYIEERGPEPEPEPKPEPKPGPKLEILTPDKERVAPMDASELRLKIAAVEEKNRLIVAENARLSRRLAELEAIMRRVSEQLMAKPMRQPVRQPVEATPLPVVPAPARIEPRAKEPASSMPLIGSLLGLVVMVLAFAAYIWRQRRRYYYKGV